jgi:hypothetical protein
VRAASGAAIGRHPWSVALAGTSRPHHGEVIPDPIIISWQGRKVRVRHDDPRLTPYSPGVTRLRSALELASDVEGLRLVLDSTLGDRYRVRVRDDGAAVGLWRRR